MLPVMQQPDLQKHVRMFACTLCVADLSLTTSQQLACAAERCLTDALGQLQLQESCSRKSVRHLESLPLTKACTHTARVARMQSPYAVPRTSKAGECQ